MRRPIAAAAGVAIAGAGAAAWRRQHRPPDLELPDVASLGGEERTVRTSDGGELAVTVAGPAGGRLFVLAHGWVCDRSTWVPVAHRLVGHGHRVALYDQRGHGRSRAGEDGFAVEALGDDLMALLEEFDARDAVVAGHSMGGMAAQAFAVRHPDVLAARVRGLALVSTASERVGHGRAAARFLGAVMARPALDRALANTAVGPWLVRSSVGRRPAPAWLHSLRQTLAATPAEVRTGCLTAMSTLDLSASLGRITVPAVVLVGSRDMLIPPQRGRLLAERLARSRLEVVKGAGHMLPFEAPARVADALRAL
jgi:non-heme chloroperoxidase